MKTIPKFINAVFLFIFVVVGAITPNAFGVSPPPEGCYPLYTTAEGCDALSLLTSGAGNTGVGWNALFSDSTGSYNTGVGAGALVSNNADSNTAVGAAALLLNSTGSENTAVGTDAMAYNDSGTKNTAVGGFALFSNTEGLENTAIGSTALVGNTTGSINVAVGSRALASNITGSQNNAFGWDALANNTSGGRNVAVGTGALEDLTNGDSNIAVGGSSLAFSETVNYNTALGRRALYRIRFVGDQNIGVGFFAGSNLSGGGANNIYIGNVGPDPIGAESNTIRLGTQTATVATEPPGGQTYPVPAHTATYIAGISGQTASDGVAVYVNSDGKLGTLTSSSRFKTDIKPMDHVSEAILALKPVTFRYKQEIDNKGIRQFGLVAEDVEKVDPDLIARDRESKPYTVRYEAVNAMLLNEFLKEHREVQEQKAIVMQLRSTLDKQEATSVEQQRQIKALTAELRDQASQIRKVNDKIELRQTALSTFANGQ